VSKRIVLSSRNSGDTVATFDATLTRGVHVVPAETQGGYCVVAKPLFGEPRTLVCFDAADIRVETTECLPCSLVNPTQRPPGADVSRTTGRLACDVGAAMIPMPDWARPIAAVGCGGIVDIVTGRPRTQRSY
jgi:hypothetical protein